jgi:hypothetical protein
MFYDKVKGLRRFKRFGEMCVTTPKEKLQSKISDKGTVCIFVGYAMSHADDVYRLLNPKTKRIMKLRDVVWLEKSMVNGLHQRQIQTLRMMTLTLKLIS